MGAVDVAIFRFINGWPEGLVPFFHFFSEATKRPYRNFVLPGLGLLVLAMLLRNARTRATILMSFAAVLLANGFTEALKTAIAFERPCVALENVHLYVGKLTSFGTASSHAANMAAVATVFCLMLGRWGLPWVLVAVFTGFSRIFVGVHFPSQVFLGAVCGIFCGFLVHRTWSAYLELRNARTAVDVETNNDV